MTYNPSDAFSKAAYTQYGASRSAAPKKPVTVKDKSGSDFGQFTRRVTNTTTSKPSTTKTTGLMSSSRDKRKNREKKTGFTVSDVKDIVTRLFSSSGGDSSPKPKPKPDPSKLYSSAAMVIPAVSAISVSELPPAAKAEASPYRSPYMRPQPMNRDSSPSVYKFAGGRDPYMERRGSPGLMAPPAPEPFNRPKIDDLIDRTVARTMLDDNTTYKIKSGDTLSGIAKMVGTTVDDLVKRNTSITDPDKIKAGATINIPVTSDTIDVRISGRNELPDIVSDFVDEMEVLEGLGGDQLLGDSMPTYSYGITKVKADEFGMKPTDYATMREFAEAFSRRYMQEKENKYNDIFQGKNAKEKVALHSYLYNAGKFYPGQLKALNNNDMSGFVKELKDVVNADGKAVTGLSKRRAAEANMIGRASIPGWEPITEVRVKGTRKRPIFEWVTADGTVVERYQSNVPLHSDSSMRTVKVN